jgi:hypothetical protein
MTSRSPDRLEKLAESVHRDYLRRHPTAELPEWARLPESERAANRAQAADIAGKLALIGGQIVDGTGDDFMFTGAELEQLARAEHERWMRDRIAHGWTAGPRNRDERTTPYLVDYCELADDVRELDRAAVRAIPALLHEAGLGIQRTRR